MIDSLSLLILRVLSLWLDSPLEIDVLWFQCFPLWEPETDFFFLFTLALRTDSRHSDRVSMIFFVGVPGRPSVKGVESVFFPFF